MSEREKGDGLLIGILVVLVILVLGGVFFGGFMFMRVQTERERAIMVMEEARAQQQAARAAAEAVPAATEAANSKPDLENQIQPAPGEGSQKEVPDAEE